MGDSKLLSAQEISRHNSPTDCWIVIDGQAWDVTDFHEEHPGGSASEDKAQPSFSGPILTTFLRLTSYLEVRWP